MASWASSVGVSQIVSLSPLRRGKSHPAFCSATATPFVNWEHRHNHNYKDRRRCINASHRSYLPNYQTTRWAKASIYFLSISTAGDEQCKHKRDPARRKPLYLMVYEGKPTHYSILFRPTPTYAIHHIISFLQARSGKLLISFLPTPSLVGPGWYWHSKIGFSYPAKMFGDCNTNKPNPNRIGSDRIRLPEEFVAVFNSSFSNQTMLNWPDMVLRIRFDTTLSSAVSRWPKGVSGWQQI